MRETSWGRGSMPKSSNWLLHIGIRFTPTTALIDGLIGIMGSISLLLEGQPILGIINYLYLL